jgi:glycosyltransferase involved in cell wall biosynthesis
MKMCQALAKNGHQVLLLAPDVPDTGPGVADPYHFYGVDNCFEIEKLPWLPFRVKGQGQLYGFLAAQKARRLQPDLAYGRLLSGCFFSSLLGVPVVYESHGLVKDEVGLLGEWTFSWLIRRPQFKRLVVISDWLKRYYQRRYSLPERMIMVARDGAEEPDPFRLMPFAGSSRLQVGYIGHLYAGRGMELILALTKNCPWADFHVVGGTDSDVAYWRDQLKALDNITLYGFVPPAQIEAYRQSCDVLLAPYQRKVSVHGNRGIDTSRWMSPLKIFEYMAAGKVILCSDLPALREVLTHEETALLCEPGNVQSWLTALKRLRDEPSSRQRLGERARAEFKAKYTWQARAENVLRGI